MGEIMTEKIKLRTLAEAEYIVQNQSTVRAAAAALGVGKSTVHTDVSTRLQSIDADLYEKTHRILAFNFSVRHIRGGDATKKKYLSKR